MPPDKVLHVLEVNELSSSTRRSATTDSTRISIPYQAPLRLNYLGTICGSYYIAIISYIWNAQRKLPKGWQRNA